MRGRAIIAQSVKYISEGRFFKPIHGTVGGEGDQLVLRENHT